jgi:hypothetical protein
LNEIIQNSPSTLAGVPSQTSILTPVKLKRRKTSSVIRKKLTRETKVPESYDLDEKIREKVRFIVGKIYEGRRYLTSNRELTPDKLFKWVMDFLSERGYWPTDEIKDKFMVALYAVFIGLRLKNIFLDPRLLSLDFQVSFKAFQKCIFECTPFITCETDVEKKIIYMGVSLDRFHVHKEYSNILYSLVPQIEDSDVEYFENRCKTLLDLLSQRGVCEEEKQFCVTTDKIFIYGLFEVLKKMFPEKTERMICDRLAERFSVPRVTIEKMKRLIGKTLKRNT